MSTYNDGDSNNGSRSRNTYIESDESNSRDDSVSMGALEVHSHSHWESLGHSRRYALEMERLQNDLIKHSFRSKKLSVIHLCPSWARADENPDSGTTEDTVLLGEVSMLEHDESLLPHWKKFADSLRNYDGDVIEKIYLAFIKLKKEVLDMLLPALKSIHVKNIEFRHNGFGNHGIALLSKILEGNSTLGSLKLYDNVIRNGLCNDAVQRFATAVSKHPSLQEFTLCGCGLGNHPGLLTVTLSACKNIKSIRLCDNKMGSREAILVSIFLATNPFVELLELRYNMFTDDDAIQFAQALRNNSNLHHFILGGNNLSQVGGEAMMKATFDTTSLNTVAESNHTCHLYLYTDGDCNELRDIQAKILYLCYHSCIGIQNTRKAKIFLALTEDDRFVEGGRRARLNISKLQNIPLQLMPEVLALLQYGEPTQAHFYVPTPGTRMSLGLLFEATKAMPMLLAYGHGRPLKEAKTRHR